MIMTRGQNFNLSFLKNNLVVSGRILKNLLKPGILGANLLDQRVDQNKNYVKYSEFAIFSNFGEFFGDLVFGGLVVK